MLDLVVVQRLAHSGSALSVDSVEIAHDDLVVLDALGLHCDELFGCVAFLVISVSHELSRDQAAGGPDREVGAVLAGLAVLDAVGLSTGEDDGGVAGFGVPGSENPDLELIGHLDVLLEVSSDLVICGELRHESIVHRKLQFWQPVGDYATKTWFTPWTPTKVPTSVIPSLL